MWGQDKRGREQRAVKSPRADDCSWAKGRMDVSRGEANDPFKAKIHCALGSDLDH